MKKRRWLWIVLPLLVLLAVPLGRALWFYRDLPRERDVPRPLSRLAGLTVQTPGPGEFTDEPAAGRGLVLIDRTHNNLFTPDELAVLTARLTARGLTVRYLHDQDLERALRPAAALVVLTPGEEFAPDEVATLRRFVERGGRLLLVADPTRYTYAYNDYGPSFLDSAVALNSLSSAFGLTFEDDYLYNVVRHEGNYQNIFLSRFAAGPLTAGLSEVVFYATTSIRADHGGLIMADADTHSSTDELGRDLIVAALDRTGRVLALGDMTFMTSPYANVRDNGRLIANIADFLAGAQRRYEVADFPHFFGDQVVLSPVGDFVLGAGHVGALGELQVVLQAQGKEAVFSAPDPLRDTLFTGLYSDTVAVAGYLEEAGIAIAWNDEKEQHLLDIQGVGQVDGQSLSLLSLHQDGERYILVILADSEETLRAAMTSLAVGDLSGCLGLHPSLLLCAAGAGDGGGWGSGRPGGGGSGNGLLLVMEDDLYFTSDDCTEAGYYYAMWLSDGYEVELWSQYDQGSPTLEELRSYDAVIWVAGTCSGKAPSSEDAETLRRYVAAGGRLLLEGMAIGSDWDGSAFYSEVCRAEHVGDGAIADVQVAAAEHPLAQGFDPTEPIPLYDWGTEYLPDIIRAGDGAVIVFARGPASSAAGTPAVLAYESQGARVIYAAFPLFFLSETELELFLLNAAAWLMAP